MSLVDRFIVDKFWSSKDQGKDEAKAGQELLCQIDYADIAPLADVCQPLYQAIIAIRNPIREFADEQERKN